MQAYTIVDVFSQHIFSGNPCSVCIWDHPSSSPLLPLIATEVASPDTIFVTPREIGFWEARFFTPTGESGPVSYALLAAAHIVLAENETGIFKWVDSYQDAYTFRVHHKDRKRLCITEPAVFVEPLQFPDWLRESLAFTPVSFGATDNDIWIECRETSDLNQSIKNLHYLAQHLQGEGRSGIVLTCEANGFVEARHIVPYEGRLVERPITARAHSSLAPFWYEKSGIPAFHVGEAYIQYHPQTKLVSLEGPCIESFQGSFLSLQGQMNLF